MPNMLLEISGEITPERMKGWSHGKNDTQLWMWLVIEARSDAAKRNIALEPGMLVHESRQIGGGQTRDGKSEHRHSRNQQTKMDWNGWFNSDDHYIYYCVQKSLRRNGVAIMVNKRVQNAVLGCNLKNDREWSLFVFKANYSISPQSKPMPQLVTLKKPKLNGSVKTYETF